jgi:hypothetical protein
MSVVVKLTYKRRIEWTQAEEDYSEIPADAS